MFFLFFISNLMLFSTGICSFVLILLINLKTDVMKNYCRLITHVFLSVIILCSYSNAQIIPNGSFENWITGNFELPVNYPFSSNPGTFLKCNAPFNVEKVADPYHGSFAMRLTTQGSGQQACFGYVINATPGDNPLNFQGGMPYNQRPTGIRGYYKSAIPFGDSAYLLLIFKQAGNLIGFYETRFSGTKTNYTLFDYTFPTPLPVNPDSVIFGMTSSDVFNGTAINGSMIQLDSISFKGVVSQPALMNGSFESWQSSVIYKPQGPWVFNEVGEYGEGMFRSTDAFAGTYALQIKSLPGADEITGAPISRPSQLGLGTIDCSGPTCIALGGIPFIKTKDTLTLRYKYLPAIGTDKAQVNLSFKKLGIIIGQFGIQLNAAASYTYVEIPFLLGQAPDSVIIQFTSGDWNNTAPGFADADLKIDNVIFKSDINTNVSDYIYQKFVKVYPNPSPGLFILQTDVNVTWIEVMNTSGQRVYAGTINKNRTEINLNQQPKGVYIYKLYNKEIAVARGKLIIE